MLLGIAALTLTGALAALGYVRYHERPRFPYMGQPLSEADYAALAARTHWHAQRLRVAPGLELRGLVREPLSGAGTWVMLFGGNTPHMLAEGQQVLDGICAEHGWGGVVWAYRGFDSSGGAPDPATLEADALKTYSKLLDELKIEAGAVHVVGFSLGSSLATAVAARAPTRPASLTLLAPMTVLYMGQPAQWRLHRYETIKWLPYISSPTLVVHGRSDTVLGIDDARSVASALGNRARLVELVGLGHDETPLSPAAQAITREFIEGHPAADLAPMGSTVRP